MTTKEDVLRQLASLGDTPEDVAEALTAKGIKGVPTVAGKCPVARYLEDLNGEPFTVFFNANWELEKHTREDNRVEVPAAVFNFIGEFDSGIYPDLVLRD